MASKILALDIDGVLIRDKLLLEHVRDNCVAYVHKKLPECKNPRETNRVLYLATGHTAKGLREKFSIDTRDFNKTVYDRRLMDHLYSVIHGSEFQQEAKEIWDLTHKGWNIALFTNAPKEWAWPVADAIGPAVTVRCPSDDFEVFKPDARAYQWLPEKSACLYVDDSLKNLGTIRWVPRWQPVHFMEGQKDSKPWCPTIGSIWELGLMVNSVDNFISKN